MAAEPETAKVSTTSCMLIPASSKPWAQACWLSIRRGILELKVENWRTLREQIVKAGLDISQLIARLIEIDIFCAVTLFINCQAWKRFWVVSNMKETFPDPFYSMCLPFLLATALWLIVVFWNFCCSLYFPVGIAEVNPCSQKNCIELCGFRFCHHQPHKFIKIPLHKGNQ